jgi:hypothetical protein
MRSNIEKTKFNPIAVVLGFAGATVASIDNAQIKVKGTLGLFYHICSVVLTMTDEIQVLCWRMLVALSTLWLFLSANISSANC